MTPITTFDAVAAPLALSNVDTDKILPGRFLKTIHRQGLGGSLFADIREAPEYVLDQPPWTEAKILVTLDNFGCGSSREHAPWALSDFGFRCIIAPSIADIFRNNCFKNGILPVVLARAEVDELMAWAADPERCRLIIDLPAQTILTGDGRRFTFDIPTGRKDDLLSGVDEITRSLSFLANLLAFEEEQAKRIPWIKPISQSALDEIDEVTLAC